MIGRVDGAGDAMNRVRPPSPDSFDEDIQALDGLLALARLIRVDQTSGDLVIQNGAARLVLERDGTIRAEGRRIVGMADEAIRLQAAFIDLN